MYEHIITFDSGSRMRLMTQESDVLVAYLDCCTSFKFIPQPILSCTTKVHQPHLSPQLMN